jgi:hypothetical protein
VAREIRTRTTIETESVSVITCRQVSREGCERGGHEEMPIAETAGSLIEALSKPLQPEGSWDRARQGLAMRLKALLRLLENTGTPPRS